MIRLRRRIETVGVRSMMISSATGRTAMVAISVLALVLTVALFTPARGSANATAPHSDPVANVQVSQFANRATPKAPVLAPATVPPLPAPTSVATAAPLSPHEVFGFVPYWSLDQSAGFDMAGLTTLAYFSLGINANGSLDESGSGWNGYESQALSTLITRAHAGGTRVVLTVNDFDQRSLDALTSNPAAAITLSQALIGAIEAENLDGVNLDLEGSGDADQAGLTRLVTTVSNTLHSVNAHWQVTMDTYASAAGDPGGFYNVSALSGAVDAFFVMEYSPNVAATAQASSPLTSSLFSDLTTVEQYAAAVPADKVILGTPLFGEDWPTTGNTLSAMASGPATTQSDSEIVGTGHPVYWDSVTDTAWTAYQVGSQWHETFFNDATSLYQIAHLADQYRLGGVGVWALGMEGTGPAMVDAFDGVPPAIQYATPGAPSTTTTTTAIAATASGAQTVTPSTTAPGAVPDAGASSAGSTPPSGPAPSIVGTFEAESLASIESINPSPSAPASGAQRVTLCVVATPPAPSVGCDAPMPPSASVPASTAKTSGLQPPFAGATMAGLITGLVVQNDAALSCLENANQSAELDSSSAISTTPELVVWQWPDNQRYYYVVVTMSPGSTSTDCANATLAFPVPPITSAAGSEVSPNATMSG